jgi:hypothetical protein
MLKVVVFGPPSAIVFQILEFCNFLIGFEIPQELFQISQYIQRPKSRVHESITQRPVQNTSNIKYYRHSTQKTKSRMYPIQNTKGINHKTHGLFPPLK